jgi:hypothetical protein
MEPRLGILFLHHHVDRVVQNNLHSIRLHHPDALIVPVSAGEPLPGGYSLEATPKLKARHSQSPATCADLMVCSWFLQRKERCDRWWVVEWDMFCNMSVEEYYRPVWHFPFVASSVRLPYREPWWYWFREPVDSDVPRAYRPYLMGALPFAFLMTDAALAATCALLLAEPFHAGNCELRFATAANRCGYAPCGYSPPNAQISWMPWKTMPARPGLVHPVKFHYEISAPLPTAGKDLASR